jgi:hypothetical protein
MNDADADRKAADPVADPGASDDGQQPISRTVGRRRQRQIGDGLPSQAERDAMTAMAQYRTRAPKGVYSYANHDEMEADLVRWTVDRIVDLHPAVK